MNLNLSCNIIFFLDFVSVNISVRFRADVDGIIVDVSVTLQGEKFCHPSGWLKASSEHHHI
jgi:hypothetical protein